MPDKYLEAGRITGTHGIRGEVMLSPTCDGPEFLRPIKRYYLRGEPIEVENARPHKSILLLKLRGIDDIDAAMPLKGATLFFGRDDALLPEGRHYVQDLIGMSVADGEGGEVFGTLGDVLQLPAHDVYIVRGAREYLIPAVKAFIVRIDEDNRVIYTKDIKGMLDRAD